MSPASTRAGGHFRGLRAAIVLAASAVLAASTPASAQLRVVSYNIAQLNGSDPALQDVFGHINLDDRPGFAVAPAVYVFQEVQTGDVTTLGVLLNNAAPAGITYAQGTYTNANENGVAGAQAMFYRSDLLTEDPTAHVDIFTRAGRNADRWKLELIGYDSPAASFYIYSAHLKASQGSTNEQLRLDGAEAIRIDANALPFDAHIIYAGDFNVYDNLEPAYLEFLSPGLGQAFDPLGTGSWSGSANSLRHTQSPNVGGIGGLVGGGLDDRFDFQLPTLEWNDNEGLSIIAGTYRSVGNDGNHFDTDINAGNNSYFPFDIPRSNALADDLHVASDHLPVAVDYRIPAVMAATLPADLGRFIVGAVHTVDVDVTNTADVVIQDGADELDFQAFGLDGLQGMCTDSVLALGDVATCMLTLDTSQAANLAPSVLLLSSSQGAQDDQQTLDTVATVVRPAVPSLDAGSVLTTLAVNTAFDPDTGVQPLDAALYNNGWDGLQSALDVDSITGLSAPFSLSGGLPGPVTGTPVNVALRIDTTGLAPGQYEATVIVNTSDEDVPGQTQHSVAVELSVAIGAGVPCPADVNGDATVNVKDLVAVILAWGSADAGADTNDDGIVDVIDLVAVILAWGDCP